MTISLALKLVCRACSIFVGLYIPYPVFFILSMSVFGFFRWDEGFICIVATLG